MLYANYLTHHIICFIHYLKELINIFEPLLFFARLSKLISMVFSLAVRLEVKSLLLPGRIVLRLKSNTDIGVRRACFTIHPVHVL